MNGERLSDIISDLVCNNTFGEMNFDREEDTIYFMVQVQENETIVEVLVYDSEGVIVKQFHGKRKDYKYMKLIEETQKLVLVKRHEFYEEIEGLLN